jgi:copper chaperone CopZ
MKTVTLKIKGMHCASCPIMIEGKLEDDVLGVMSAQANYVRQECLVEYDEDKLDVHDLTKAIEGIGYTAAVGESDL